MTGPRARIFRNPVLFLGIAVTIFALWLRHDAFWLPHWKGDQNHFIVLAMKLDRLGLDHYSLGGVRMGWFETEPGIRFAAVSLQDPADAKTGGDDTFFYRHPPLLPYLLAWSKRAFASDSPAYLAFISDPLTLMGRPRPPIIFERQFYAAIVPLAFNLASVFLTFVLGWYLFDGRTGLYAGFLMATNATGLTTASRVLPEDVTTFFVTASLFLFHIFFDGRLRYPGVFFAGALAGLAVLAESSAALLFPIVWAYTVLRVRKEGVGPAERMGALLDTRLLLYAAAAVAVSAFWFVKGIQVYGEPFHTPEAGMRAEAVADVSGWLKAVRMRPHPSLFFTFGLLALCPAFGAVLFTAKKAYADLKALWKRSIPDSPEVFLWLWVGMFYLTLAKPWALLSPNDTQEHRYFYLAYPALCILAASAFARLASAVRRDASLSAQDAPRRAFAVKRGGWVGEAVVWALLFLNACWSLPQGTRVLWANNMLL